MFSVVVAVSVVIVAVVFVASSKTKTAERLLNLVQVESLEILYSLQLLPLMILKFVYLGFTYTH